MTTTILKKMKEKEKKSDRKSVPEKGMKRNKTTVNFNRNKLDKSEKEKQRKSLGIKTGTDKKSKTFSTTIRTEGNEKKEKDKKDKIPKITSKKELLSKSVGGKTLSKSKTLSSLTSQKNKGLPSSTKDKKKEDKKVDKKKEEKKIDDKKKLDKTKDKKEDKSKKEDKNKKEDKTKKEEKSKKGVKSKKEEKEKKDEKKEEKKSEKKEEKKLDKKDKKLEEKKGEKKSYEKKDEKRPEEKKEEEKNDEIKPAEKKEEKKVEEKKEERKNEEKNEEVETEENKDGKKPEEKNEEKKLENKKEETEKKEGLIKAEENKIEHPKKENKVLTMKILSNLDKYASFLTNKDLLIIASVSKKFSSTFLPKLKENINQKLSKEEKELESITTENVKLLNEFKLGKLGEKALGSLNNKIHTEYFQKDDIPNNNIILEYRVLYQLINKEKDILKVSNNIEFYKIFKEHIVKSSEKGIGDFLQNEFKNLDFSEENIYKIHSLCEGQEASLSPSNIGKKENDNPAGYINLLIKDPLEYVGINIGTGKNKKYGEVFKKYLEYIIKRRKNDEQKLDKMISKLSS